ncbi:MAG: ATPase [Bacillota bacterium]
MNDHKREGDERAMKDLLILMIPGIIVGLIATILLPLFYRNKEKKDKGRVFVYYKLSYRRKMIRTLWSIPIIVILIIAIFYLAELDPAQILTLAVFFLVFAVIQFIYNYLKWKKLEQ